ncbi:unnamed protein product, partial [Symbiodinium sp. CCMP2456]
VLQPSCIMSQTLRVDLQADDRGLHSCFAASGVKQDWIQAVVSHHRLETLDDFVYMINKGEWESSLAAFVQEVGVIRDNRLALARFKAAWQAGSAAIAASQQAATRHQQETDLEEPLPEATTQQLQHDFQKAYGFVVETHLEPSDALRGRVYREFRRHTMTVIEARKIKSVVAQATPQREESVSLQGGLTLNFHKDSVVTLRNAVDYFWSLRILAYAWAWAGNYISKDIDGKDKKMIDLTSALNYADLALRWCMEFGNGQLSWIQRNDVLTRGKLASRVRRGQNVGSALEEVLLECRLEWRTPSSSAFASPPPSLESGNRRKVIEEASSPDNKQRRLNTVSMAKGGRKFCKPWNDSSSVPDSLAGALRTIDRITPAHEMGLAPLRPQRGSLQPLLGLLILSQILFRLQTRIRQDFSENAVLQVLQAAFCEPVRSPAAVHFLNRWLSSTPTREMSPDGSGKVAQTTASGERLLGAAPEVSLFSLGVFGCPASSSAGGLAQANRPYEARAGPPICNQRPSEVSTELASRLRAARPVTWRGGGDLPQLPNISAPRGTWLVLDMWAGISGLCVALLALGLHFYGLAAEVDSTAVECAKQVMPSLVHTARAEDIQVETLLPFVHRRQLRGIILGGGAPGLTETSSHALHCGESGSTDKHPALLARLADELRHHPDLVGVEVFVFLEGAADLQPPVRDRFSTLLQASPVFSDARFCGWSSRRRLYWLSSATRSLGPDHGKPPFDWSWQSVDESARHELRYVGKKPLPRSVGWEGGFCPIFEPSLVMQAQVSPFSEFTVECRQPFAKDAAVPPAVLDRFFQDSRRFPVQSYSEGSLLWNETQWRQPSPSERAQILGVPESLMHPRGPDAPTRHQRANSLLGQGFHVFTVMAIFAMLPGLCESKMPLPLSLQDPLQERIAGTLWEPNRLRAFPGLLDPEALVLDMQSQFRDFSLSNAVWHDVLHRLTSCDLLLPQASVAYARGTGADWQLLGPTVINRRLRAAAYTSNSGQRYSSESAKGLDFLLQPGLGKERHILAAKALPSPFQPKPWPELDIHFVLHTLAVWRENLPLLAQRQRDALRAIHRALRPLDAALWPFRCSSSQRVAHQKSPAFAACMVSLLRWPDRTIAADLVRGFSIVGEIPPSGVFRKVPLSQASVDTASWLAEEGAASVDAILQSGPPRMHKEIFEVTSSEIEKGFCSPLMTRAQVDARFGYGQWRPLERFVLQQQEKSRVIDNARSTHHNENTVLSETIFTTSVDFVACVARDAVRALARGECPEWLHFRVGTEDLPEAYRGLPVREDHLRFSVVAIYVPDLGWRFSIMWGLAYGLESAVVSFNRFPALGTAIARRCCSSLCSFYFDDELALECMREADVSRQGVLSAFSCLGAPPQPPKSFHPTPDRHYLGVSVHLGLVSSAGVFRVQPKFSTLCKVLRTLHHVLHTGTLLRDTAGKLRGDLQWFFSACSGFSGRYAGPVLRKFQHGETSKLSEADVLVLQCLLRLVRYARPREISMTWEAPPFMLIYTDASFEAGELRLGWVIFDAAATPLGGTCLVPQHVVDSWKPRKQQIFVGETLAVLLLPLLYGDLFRGRDALWFVDNQGAVTAAVSGASPEGDVHEIAHIAAYLRSQCSFQAYFEWIDSESNPSDGLSRLGLGCTWSQNQGWQLAEHAFPEAALRTNLQKQLESL